MIRNRELKLSVLMIYFLIIFLPELCAQDTAPTIHRYQVDYRFRDAFGQKGHLRFDIVVRSKNKENTKLWIGISSPKVNKLPGKKKKIISNGRYDTKKITVIRNDSLEFQAMFISYDDRYYRTQNLRQFVEEIGQEIPAYIYIMNNVFRLFVYSFPQQENSTSFQVPVRVSDQRNNSELPHKFMKRTQPDGNILFQNEYLIRRNWPVSKSATFISQTLMEPNHNLSFFEHQIIEINRNIYKEEQGQSKSLLQNTIRAELTKIDQ